MTICLHFHGAAGTVTGSCYRVVHPKGQFLVDCGLFQGNKSVDELNYKEAPFQARAIDFVLVTHAHIDHIGLIPRLFRKGFRNALHLTEPTGGLMEFLLQDAAGIQVSENERFNRKRGRRGLPPLEPLYELKDAERALQHRSTHSYDEWFEPGAGVRARFWNAGHILGSASIEVEVADDDGSTVRLLFSGDIGPDEKSFHDQPEAPSGFDYILCESTYGGRDREAATLAERRVALGAEITAALGRGGNLIIPAFAVERSQELLHDIGVLIAEGSIDPSIVFLDSPLASRITNVYRQYAELFEDVELTADQLFRDKRFRIVEDVEQSKAINSIHGGAIIISASGMCDAGRIKHHLRNNISRSEATILFVGYQAAGTLGQIIQSGAREVRIHGRELPVRATVRTIANYSAHADHGELLAWIRARLPISGAIFLTHGDDEPRRALRQALLGSGVAGDQVILPLLDDSFDLRAEGIAAAAAPTIRQLDLAQIERDWHNEYADFSIKLGHALHAAANDQDRLALMERMQRALGGEPR